MSDTTSTSTPVTIYPTITVEEIDNKVKSDGDKARAIILLNKSKELDNQLQNYTKKKSHWITNNSIVRKIGHTFAIIFNIGTVITSCPLGIDIPFLVPTILGTIGGISSFVTEYIARFYTGKKKLYYINQCNQVTSMIDKASHLFNRALTDGIITQNEYNEFVKLIDDNIQKLKTDDTQEEEQDKIFWIDLMKESKDTAMKEFRENKLQEMKSIELQKLNQKYSSV
jgi:hypothetical protein